MRASIKGLTHLSHLSCRGRWSNRKGSRSGARESAALSVGGRQRRGEGAVRSTGGMIIQPDRPWKRHYQERGMKESSCEENFRSITLLPEKAGFQSARPPVGRKGARQRTPGAQHRTVPCIPTYQTLSYTPQGRLCPRGAASQGCGRRRWCAPRRRPTTLRLPRAPGGGGRRRRQEPGGPSRCLARGW
jgi:hypothetical protein